MYLFGALSSGFGDALSVTGSSNLSSRLIESSELQSLSLPDDISRNSIALCFLSVLLIGLRSFAKLDAFLA